MFVSAYRLFRLASTLLVGRSPHMECRPSSNTRAACTMLVIDETIVAARLLVCLSKSTRMCGTYGCVLPDRHSGLHKLAIIRGDLSDCGETPGDGGLPIVAHGIRQGSRVRRRWNPTTKLLSAGKWHYGTVCYLRQAYGSWRAQVKYDDGLCQWVNPTQLHIVDQVKKTRKVRSRTNPLKADGTPDMRFNINARRS